MSLLIRIQCWGKEIGEICEALYAKLLCQRIRHAECALKISTLQRRWGICIYELFLFHLLDSLILRPNNVIQIYSAQNWQCQRACPSGVNTYINKCYPTKHCKRIFWGSISYVWKLICRTNCHTELQMICGVSPITSYIL